MKPIQVATWVALSVLLLFAAGSCGPAREPSFPDEDRLLEDLMEAYVSGRFAFYPAEGTLSGLPGNDDRLGSFDRLAIEGRIQWLDDFHFRLMGIRLDALTDASYLDAMWLTGLLKSERFELEERAVWRKSASFYEEPIRLGIVSLLTRNDLEQRADALLGRLAGVPRLVAQARENLGPTSAVWRLRNLEALDSCRRLLEELPELASGRLGTGRMAELRERTLAARRAISELREHVLGLSVGPDDARMGRDGLQDYVRHRYFTDWSLDRLVSSAEQALSSATHELTQRALSQSPSVPLRELLEARPLGAPAEAIVSSAAARATAVLRERGIVEAEATVPVRRVPASFPGSEPVLLWRTSALEPSQGEFLMVRSVAPSDGLDADALELLTLRELGGRHMLYELQSGSVSLLRRVVADPASSSGWLDAVSERWLASGHARAEPLYLEVYQRRRLDQLRVLGMVGFHALGENLDEVAARFVARGLLSEDAALREARLLATDPDRADAGIGALLIADLLAELRDEHHIGRDGELLQNLLEPGVLPVPLLRFHRLGPRLGGLGS